MSPTNEQFNKPDENRQGQPAGNVGPESAERIRQSVQAKIEATAWGQIEPQLERLDDYLKEALAKPDAQESIIAVSNYSMMRCLTLMTPDLEVELARTLGTAKKTKAVMDSLEIVHRLARQVNRSADLGRRLALDRREEEVRRQKDSPQSE